MVEQLIYVILPSMHLNTWSVFILLKASEKTLKNKMKPTNPNAHTYVNGTDVKTHGYAVTHNTFLQ